MIGDETCTNRFGLGFDSIALSFDPSSCVCSLAAK